MTDFDDPFAGGVKTPAVSFKDAAIGTEVELELTGPAKLVQSRNYTTGEPDYWDAAKTQPKMSAVVNGILNGEERSVWAQKPSNMFTALAQAQQDAGKRFDKGGKLRIKLTGETPHTNPRFNAIKEYAALYTPPVEDAFSDEPPF